MLRAYITNLSEYVAGRLVGAWITLPIGEDELEEVLHQIGIGPNAEEYFSRTLRQTAPWPTTWESTTVSSV